MPKQKQELTQEEQSKRFRDEVERMIADGELNPKEADKAFEGLVRNSVTPRK